MKSLRVQEKKNPKAKRTTAMVNTQNSKAYFSLSCIEDISPYYRLTAYQVEGIAKDLSSDDRNLRIFAAQHIAKFVLEPAKALIDYITKGDCIKILTVKMKRRIFFLIVVLISISLCFLVQILTSNWKQLKPSPVKFPSFFPHNPKLILVPVDIAAGPYDLWIKSASIIPYLISLLDSDNMVTKVSLIKHTHSNTFLLESS